VSESAGELMRRYRQEGDLAARTRLIELHMPLVHSLARRYANRGEPLEDLVQIGAIGLIKAVDRFDPERGVALTTYAMPTIIGEIKRYFRDRSWAVRVPRGLQELGMRLTRVLEQLTVELGRSPTISELAEATGAGEEEVLEAMESSRAYASVPLATQPEGDDATLAAFGATEPAYEASEDRAVLAPGLAALGERERGIIVLRFYAGLTQSQIAQRIGVSQMHVSRLIRRSLERIRLEIGVEEPTGAQRG
jgi:RNA polymerase sigma-B factor